MIQEVWSCDRPGCEEESPPCFEQPPFNWVEVTHYGGSEETDMNLHYCGWECAMHGMARALEVHEHLEMGGASETG